MKFRTKQVCFLAILLLTTTFPAAAQAAGRRRAAEPRLYRLASRPGAERVYDSARRAFRCGPVREKRRLKVYAGKVVKRRFFERAYTRPLAQLASDPSSRRSRQKKRSLLSARKALDAACLREVGICGDRRLTAAETCDDGNRSSGDGCVNCQIESGWGCIGQPSSCTQNSASITPSLSPSRTSGVAPLVVFFDASATTASSTQNGFRELDFAWDFGDPASGNWAESGRSRNQARNALAAHVFDAQFSEGETERTFNVTLRIRDASGVMASAQTAVTVQNPDVVFAGGKTRCVSTAGNFDGCPAGAEKVTSSDFAAQMSWVNGENGRRLLFRRSETWPVSKSAAITASGPSTLSAFGPCAAPNERGICANAPRLVSGQLTVFDFNVHHTRPDWRISHLYLSGEPCDMPAPNTWCGTGISGLNGLKQELIYRTKVTGFRVGIGNSSWEIPDDEVAIVDSEVSQAYVNQVFIGSSRLMLLGNHFQESAISHVLRVWQAHYGVISENRIEKSSFQTPETGRHALKLHGPSHDKSVPKSEFIVVSNNIFGASGPWPVGIGPQDAHTDERLREIVVEGNQFKSATSGNPVQVSLLLWCRHAAVRNNLFEGTGNGVKWYRAISVGPRGIEPAPRDISIYNNTAFHGDEANSFVFAGIDSSVEGASVMNNLAASPLVKQPLLLDNHSASTSEQNNLLVDAAAFVNAASGDYHLLPACPAIDGGVPVPALTDMDGKARPIDGNGDGAAAWDVGAFEYSRD